MESKRNEYSDVLASEDAEENQYSLSTILHLHSLYATRLMKLYLSCQARPYSSLLMLVRYCERRQPLLQKVVYLQVVLNDKTKENWAVLAINTFFSVYLL